MTDQNPEIEKARTKHRDICGVTMVGATGIVWVCIKKVHASIYLRRSSDKTHRRGGIIYDSNSNADRHYFVNKYPNRGNNESRS